MAIYAMATCNGWRVAHPLASVSDAPEALDGAARPHRLEKIPHVPGALVGRQVGQRRLVLLPPIHLLLFRYGRLDRGPSKCCDMRRQAMV